MSQRLSRLIRFSFVVGLSAAVLLLPAWAAGKQAVDTTWRIAGDLSEACTCSVPCSCNFGEGPSPQHFCWALFSLDIQKGRYGTVNLDGLRLAAGCGAKGMVFYLDDRATPAQAAALRAITTQMMARFHKVLTAMDPKALQDPSVKLLAFKTAHIEQEVGKTRHRLVIGNQGGFESEYLVGIDGKTPIVVENNWSWNIQHGIKGKTKRLHYKDEFGNEFEMAATNANQGRFDWSDKTLVYFR